MWRVTRTDGRHRGFTLLELLVAMAIFSIASVIAYSGLHAIASTKSSLDREIRFWRELGQIFERMNSDFVQISPHLFQAENGENLPPLRGGSADNSGFFIELTRYDEERTPVHASYRCDEGKLDLRLDPLDDRQRLAGSATRSAPVFTLLENVEHCDAAFLGANKAWFSAWPGDQSAIKPYAIRIRLTLAERGKFERIFYLP